jgi:hypothetical protein
MKVEDIMIDNRVCLKPLKWQELYEAIQKAYPEREIPKPLTTEEWKLSGDMQKKIRFCMHLEFAITAGVADKILDEVTKDDWYCLN